MCGQLLADVFRRDKRFDVVDATGKSIETMVDARSPHVVLVSDRLEANACSGFDVLRSMRASYPKVPVGMLLERSEQDLILKAFRGGARGVFCRCERLSMLPKCVRTVCANQIWISGSQLEFVMEALAEAPATNLVGVKGQLLLSKRESQVVHYLTEGFSNREIADELNLSEHTIKNYLFRIFDKLGVSSRVEVILYATSQRASSERARSKSA